MKNRSNKYRTSSIYLALNKQGIRSAKRLRDIANGEVEATREQTLANESILRLLLPYDRELPTAPIRPQRDTQEHDMHQGQQ